MLAGQQQPRDRAVTSYMNIAAPVQDLRIPTKAPGGLSIQSDQFQNLVGSGDPKHQSAARSTGPRTATISLFDKNAAQNSDGPSPSPGLATTSPGDRLALPYEEDLSQNSKPKDAFVFGQTSNTLSITVSKSKGTMANKNKFSNTPGAKRSGKEEAKGKPKTRGTGRAGGQKKSAGER